jgi:hypothetical protein
MTSDCRYTVPGQSRHKKTPGSSRGSRGPCKRRFARDGSPLVCAGARTYWHAPTLRWRDRYCLRSLRRIFNDKPNPFACIEVPEALT